MKILAILFQEQLDSSRAGVVWNGCVDARVCDFDSSRKVARLASCSSVVIREQQLHFSSRSVSSISW